MCRALAVPYSQLSLALPCRANARGFGLVASGFGLACANTSTTPRRTFFFFVGSSRRAMLSQHVHAVSMILSKDSRSIPSNYLGVSLAAGKRRTSRSLPLANRFLLPLAPNDSAVVTTPRPQSTMVFSSRAASSGAAAQRAPRGARARATIPQRGWPTARSASRTRGRASERAFSSCSGPCSSSCPKKRRCGARHPPA